MDLNKIKGCGVLPVARIGGGGGGGRRGRGGKGEVMFLLGREQVFEGWSGSGKYADFGGAKDKGENVIDCAAREGYEEGMGFLGTKDEILAKVTPKNPDYVDAFVMPNEYEHMLFAIKIYYNKYMPVTFKNVYDYFTNCAKKIPQGKYVIESCPEGFLEKDEVKWFSYNELKSMTENDDKTLRSYFKRCLNVMFSKYPTEQDMLRVL